MTVTEPELTGELDDIRERYTTQYHLNWRDYGYRWHPRNRLSVYYRQAQERALVDLFNHQGMHLDELRVLDMGCGAGSALRFLISLGVEPQNAAGCDLVQERLREGHRLNPALAYAGADATRLPFASGSFDLVCQFTMFSSTSLRMQSGLAREILRVLRPGGGILWYDMRGPFPSGPLRGIERADLQTLFAGCHLEALKTLHSRLSPRLLRLGHWAAVVADMLPFLRRTHYLALLRKPAAQEVSQAHG
jgi:SAM-dependent methyltransferase